ncbi:UNVERIFIED_ORG: glycosyltransferase involved in cell wall biosynthesis/type II secretory pathway pseudopilin PulG [Variovorax guangxiensis]
MRQPNACLVALATAWGPQFGGINAFNVEWVRSLGIAARRDYQLVCVVPQADAADQEDARRHHVSLVPLGSATSDLPADQADAVLAEVRSAAGVALNPGTVVWLGHDDKTGALALALRAAVPGSRAVLVHHMAFRAYQDVKKDGAGAAGKQQTQRELFSQADLCLAVGPMLRDHLRDILPPAKRSSVTMLVPGLAEPNPQQVPLSDQAPANFIAFLGGRLGSDDERIKQALLGVRGFGRAVGQCRSGANDRHALSRSPSLRMRGVPIEQRDQVVTEAEAEALGMVECDVQPYTEDRRQYFSDLASSSVALMPSWHEGFGLVAWEAIACQVPVVIGQQSGVHRLLHEHWQGAGLGRSVRPVQVAGRRSQEGEAPHTDGDVTAVARALLELGDHMADAKADAVLLAQRLRRSHTWKDCAETTLQALESHLGMRLQHAWPGQDAPPSDGAPQPVSVHPQPSRPPTGAGAGDAPGNTDIPEFLQPPKPQAAVHARQLGPAALLAAQDQVVRFHRARDAFVDGVLDGVTTPGLPRLTTQVIHGPGGAGKTRSALELLRRAAPRGWSGLWLSANPPADALDFWQRLLLNHARPLLLVVDYAEGRQADLLRWLRTALGDALKRPDGLRVHLLCLSRSTDWWHQLSRQPECDTELAAMLAPGLAHFGLTAVPDWPNAPADRALAFDAALSDYATALGEPEPTYPWRPDLASADYARPLYLHLAALAALAGERPGHGHGLLAALLRREWRHWQRNAPPALAGADRWDDWADALALLAFSQGLEANELGAALEHLAFAQPGEWVGALARIYPSQGGNVGSLTPDLLAEHLLVERLSANRAHAWLAVVFGHGETRRTRAMAVLARLWPRAWPAALNSAKPDLGAQRLVDALAALWLDHGKQLIAAVHQHGMALTDPVTQAWRTLPQPVQQAIALSLRLPSYSTPLLALTIDIRRSKVDAAADEASRAGALNDLAIGLSYLGDAASRAEALRCAREAAETYRTLAQTQLAAHLPDLAGSLNNLANRLSEQGDAASRAEALRCAREAVETYRTLVQTLPAAYLPNLAGSLNNLANRLSKQGDAASRAEALRCAREAVETYRTLAQTQPAAHLPNLAMSLNNLASRLSEQGDAASLAEALRCAREAVEIRRTLAQTQPAAYLPDLAGSLNNLANHLSKQGDAASRAEALRCAREAVETYRTLVQTLPAAYLPNLAMSLNNLANRLSEQGDAASLAEALRCAREAVETYRTLVQTQPAAYLPDLAGSLNNLANRLSKQGDAASLAEALRCAREAAETYRTLAQTQPAAHLPDLAGSLNNLANRLSEQGDAASRAKALRCAREAVEIRRTLAQTQPAAYLPDLAGSLNNLANHLSKQGDAASLAEALRCAREAVEIRRTLAQTLPAAYLPNLAMSLNNLANRLSEQGDAASLAEALRCAREAVEIRRTLAQTQPAAYLPDLAGSLNNLANHLSKQGDAASRAEALRCAREAVETYRTLVQTQPAAHLPNLAMSLNNLANRLSEQGDAASRAEALRCAREAVEIRRTLAQTQPAAYLSDLAGSLNNLANRLSKQGDAASRAEALRCAREAVETYRTLVQSQPAAHLPDLAGSLSNLANRLSEQGDVASRAKALRCAREAVEIYTAVSEQQPARFHRNLDIAKETLDRIANQPGI